MSLTLGSLLVLLSTPFLATALHAAACRGLSRRFPRQALALLCCLAGAATTSLVVLSMAESRSFGLALFVVLASLLLVHPYFHLFNMSETARRIRLLVDLKLGLPVYTPEDQWRVRLERLTALGQIELREGRYHAKPTLLRLVALAFESLERWLFPKR